jgi:ClpP class serine protease
MLDKDYDNAEICNKKQTMISDALVKHATSLLGQRVDAKTILLVDKIGGVEKPTAQTLNLLGSRTSRVKRQQKAKESDDKRPIEDDQVDFLGFIRPMKRFHGNLDRLDTTPGQVVYRCAYGDCQKYFLTE